MSQKTLSVYARSQCKVMNTVEVRKGCGLLMNAEKHVREKERLNQALSGKLSEIQSEMEQFFRKYAMDAMPGLAHDVSCYVIEELYLSRFNLPKY